MNYETLKAKCEVCRLAGKTPYTERWHIVAAEGETLTVEEMAFVAGQGTLPTHYVKEGNIMVIEVQK